jgi:hypothetical protein
VLSLEVAQHMKLNGWCIYKYPSSVKAHGAVIEAFREVKYSDICT